MGELRVKDLSVEYATERGTLSAVDDLTLSVDSNEIFGLVGESGAGKSTVGRAIMGLIESPGRIPNGEIRYNGRDLLSLSESEMRTVRGQEISMVFQDPQASLNPVLTVGQQLRRVFRSHKGSDHSKEEETNQIVEALAKVQIPNPASRLDDYPVQFSGGMSQRVMIAMALLSDPSVLVADEPTSNLDVTIESNILNLLKDLRDREDLTILLITHNMGVVAHHCDRVGIMYAGKLVEEGTIEEVFNSPGHPYTRDLMRCVPRPDRHSVDRLITIEGRMPTPIDLPDACYYATRCEHAQEQCWRESPSMKSLSNQENQRSACHFREEIVNETSASKGDEA